MTRRPHARRVDTTSSAVDKDAFDDQVEILFPIVHHVVAEQDFAKTRPVDLDARIAFIAFDGFCATEDFGALHAIDHFSAHFSSARVNADGLAWDAGLKERR